MHIMKRIHAVLISKCHQPFILSNNTVDNWGCTLSHEVEMLIIIIIILYLPKAIQLKGIYRYNQYKNIFTAEHDN